MAGRRENSAIGVAHGSPAPNARGRRTAGNQFQSIVCRMWAKEIRNEPRNQSSGAQARMNSPAESVLSRARASPMKMPGAAGHPAARVGKKLTLRPLVRISLAVALLLSACGSTPPTEPVVIQDTAVAPVPTLDSERVVQGERLYGAFCASCHGAQLEGQPDWQQPRDDGSLRAPPQDASGHTWHHPDDLLLQIIAEGGDPSLGLTMPGFQEQLDEAEMGAVLEFIKSSWGEQEREFQWWISAR